MGGKNDSTRTRVAPTFDAISATGPDWLKRLLRLPKHGAPGSAVRWSDDLRVLEFRWGAKEKLLNPPRSLLEWLVNNLEVEPPPAHDDPSEAAEMRRRLFRRDPETIAVAMRHLAKGITHRRWWVLEGPTHPDVYLETPDAIVVIEGKYTERGPTTYTQWMPIRHQMHRHLDAAWEIRGGKRVYGFFIVEGDGRSGEVTSDWLRFAEQTYSDKALIRSLPHRCEEREALARCFLGVTTWQNVLREFGLTANIYLGVNTCARVGR